MESSAAKWQDAERQILDLLDIRAEYESFGLRLASGRPNAKGWIYSHADGRDDNCPSAGICADGVMKGLYRDQRGGAAVNFFSFAAEKRFGGDRRAARKFYAEKTGVKLPSGSDEHLLDRLLVSPLAFSTTQLYVQKKSGVTRQAIEDCGGQQGVWPKNAPPQFANHCLAFPMFGAPLTDGEPIGWHIVTQNPELKIRVFQGKDKPERFEKSLSLGSVGLFNPWALDRIVDAQVVWLVEGISDLLAIQGVIPRDGSHVATTTGGCTAYIAQDWLAHFAGKDVRIVYDVGDVGDAGQVAAKVQAGLLHPVAGSVKIVMLPLGPEDPATKSRKNDLRAWLVAGHSFEDLCRIAEASDPYSPPIKESEKLTPARALLNSLGCIVTGQIEASETIEIFSTVLNKRTTVRDIDKFTINKAVLALGPEVVDKHLTDGQSQEAAAGRATIHDLRKAIVSEASRNILTESSTLGQGVWRVGDRLVLVGRAEAYSINGCPELEPSRAPAIGDKRINFASEQWFDAGKLRTHLSHAHDPEWCRSTVNELVALLEQWNNWSHPANARIAAGLMLASWIQTVWESRPLVSVVGPSNSGKTHLFDHLIKPFFGHLITKVAKPSEASIRQIMKDTARVLLIDEFEADHGHRKNVIELLRTSTKGDKVSRGGAGGRAVSYGLQHIVWVGGIELGLDAAADRNRYLVLELSSIPEGSGGKLRLPPADAISDLGQRCLAVVLRRWKECLATWSAIRGSGMVHLSDRRLIELYCVPAATLAACRHEANVDAWEMVDAFTRDRGFRDDETPDEVELLRSILAAHVLLPGGVRVTVGQLLQPGMIEDRGSVVDKQGVLESVGIKPTNDGKLFIAGSRVSQHLIKGYNGSSINQILKRLNPEGYRKQATQRVARVPAKGVLLEKAVVQAEGVEVATY